jgi:transcriptional regulator with XRE-family HTH domain
VHSVDTTGLPIGTALRIERVAARVSLTHVARAVGVSIGQLSRIESGDRTASVELIERIRVAVRSAARAAS